ncbi:hypothetical protein GUJ93_ZPchr0002g23688 [Zizania palustris]|uniref:Uncharacterized protein n=1 Tax=Zizania palustris TaxID=103762 RepID=A0A8J5S5T8_ZIZPA|nr:hypothetical protein GUJ93_ZPchr0002g23688 [Zizania palustris]
MRRVSLEEQHLRIENARLKDELDRVCALAGKFLGRPISSISSTSPPSLQACSGLELGVGSNGFVLGSLGATALQSIPDLMGSTDLPGSVGSTGMCLPAGIGSLDGAMHGAGPDGDAIDRAMLLELALAAMDELVKMA